ncbi:hypothetical protein JTB14_009288 [Gonioctena quinquepunctata]|nr:hypothetical protein JTB14_009288 [Gonioctena quinquepunctata]
MMDGDAALFLFNEVLNSDSSTSSEDEVQARGPMIPHPRVQGYIEEVVDHYSDEEFRENFRMNRPTFNHVLLLINEQISSDIVDKGRHTIPAKAQLLIALWHFGTPDSYSLRSICGRFNIGRATALRTVRRVAEALFSLSKTICKWPTGPWIVIHKQKRISKYYLAVCDHPMKFTHCYAGEVGSNHDATVLRRSEIWTYMNNGKFPNNTHLIGDKAYPCLQELIPPYKNNGHFTDAQKNFNFLLSRTRATIERSFCLLQKRFRCLKELLDMQCLEWAPKYVIACCVLYNICILQNDIIDFEFNPAEDENDDPHIPEIPGTDKGIV